jgi:hypothetical protein
MPIGFRHANLIAMTTASTVSTVAKTPVSGHKLPFAATVGLCTVIWFVLLSGWFGLVPGTVLATRPNVMFSSDTSAWIDRFAGSKHPRVYPYGYVHPLEEFFWRPPCRVLAHLLGLFLSSDYAKVLAARILPGILFGMGTACLALLALRNGLGKTQCALLFAIYFLFTSSSTAVLPEHFAISNGLLSIAFTVPFFVPAARMRNAALGLLTVLAGGTIITNFVFPAGLLIRLYEVPRRVKLRFIGIFVVGAAALSLLMYHEWSPLRWFVLRYMNVRLLHPLKAGLYTFGMLLWPVVGPMPRVLRYPGFDQVSYEPLNLTAYNWIQAVAAIAWLTLLVRCVWKAAHEKRLRPEVWTLLGWLLFEAVLHNVWGDEYLLYAPDWTWALMGLVVLGAPYLSRRFLNVIVIPIAIGQACTLIAIRAGLHTITR